MASHKQLSAFSLDFSGSRLGEQMKESPLFIYGLIMFRISAQQHDNAN